MVRYRKKQRRKESGSKKMGPAIRQMITELVKLSDEQWGSYAFCHEPLERKFTAEQKKEYTRRAIACGEREGELFESIRGVQTVEDAAIRQGLKIQTPDVPSGGGHVLFAQYVEPDEITVFMDCVKKAEKLIEEENLQSELAGVRIYDLLLAHELFHYIEHQKEDAIYTQTEKIELWRKPFSNRSRIICLSEIAAMAFAKKVVRLPYSPYVMDVLLMYSYNEEAAAALYEEIMEVCKE